MVIYSFCVIAKGGMVSRPERRVEILLQKGSDAHGCLEIA